ncbi:hypothetical protein RHSIM_Rhsim08G0058200 [Rhododendron simsii]|uniref:Peptidase metallopeptidase domain-containing protein n=1 Tax=Rhododendron simsii TaxID=118357 RepID=A0A834GN20_RHOSS|nr:hypothetical protein RHSIM_Rhsim08G0058200 [Rhododendron simsii]
MATKVFRLILCIFLFSLAVSPPSHARPTKPKVENPTSFNFIKPLKGCQKGQTVKGLQQLKKYLEAFGYLNYSLSQAGGANNDDFDDSLEAAVKTYQVNYHLKTARALDAETVSQMTALRCGDPAQMPYPLWPKHLARGLPNLHLHSLRVKTLQMWIFKSDSTAVSLQCRLFFYREPGHGLVDLETVALHEIGHLLGLAYSDVREAIMWPSIPPATIKGLKDDDIQGIKTLYA